MTHRIVRWALMEKETIMSNTATATANVIFDPAIHATDAEGNPVMRKDGTFSLKRGRKAGTPNGVSITRKSFDVNAISAAYLARAMASGDLDGIMAFNGMTKGQRVEFLTTTPEYADTVGAKVVADAAAKILAILEAAGEDLYPDIMAVVRGDYPDSMA